MVECIENDKEMDFRGFGTGMGKEGLPLMNPRRGDASMNRKG